MIRLPMMPGRRSPDPPVRNAISGCRSVRRASASSRAVAGLVEPIDTDTP
jgi:hypothetical protein